MKKTLLGIALTAVLFGIASCDGGHKEGRSDLGDHKDVYTGLLPAADCAGIRYTLRLDYDDDHNCTVGDYDLVETYLVTDSLSHIQHSNSVSYQSKGDFTVASDTKGGKYIELVPDRHYRNAERLYFLITSDSTLTMTTRDLELPASGFDYTLRKAK